MRLLASIDGLTGLLNKKYFLETLSEEIKRASAKAPLSLSMMDLDHFKNVNDTYGHQAGDHVLKEIADIMTRSLRESDSICRFGGEEIAVLMPGTSKSLAIEIIEALRIKISNTPVCQTDDGPLFITVSGGVATYPGDGETLEELLQNSDAALYKSKRNGRNMISGFAS
jgi:diguanylate cyclase (GGDEF)-like protein